MGGHCKAINFRVAGVFTLQLVEQLDFSLMLGERFVECSGILIRIGQPRQRADQLLAVIRVAGIACSEGLAGTYRRSKHLGGVKIPTLVHKYRAEAVVGVDDLQPILGFFRAERHHLLGELAILVEAL